MASGTNKQKAPKLTKWLDAIQTLLKVREEHVNGLAAELNKNYIQVYKWVVDRTIEPRGEAALILIAWALSKDPRLIRLFDIRKGGTIVKFSADGVIQHASH